MVGAALLLASCTGIGFRIARDFRERPRQIRAVMHALRLLQAEIAYSATPLPAALRRVAARSQPPADRLFEAAANALGDGEQTVAAAFADGIQRCRRSAALKAYDYEVIAEFGKTLGASDRAHQTQRLEVALHELAELEREAVESQRRNERLCQYLGVLAGLLLVILLY